MPQAADIDNPIIISRFYKSDESNVAEVIINGHTYGINIDNIKESQREWFLTTFTDILTRVDKRARFEVSRDRAKKLRNLCGLD